MSVAALDTLHSYAAAYRFLNRVLDAEYERTGSSEWYFFISYNAELHDGGAGLGSHDPAYWPGDWSAALRGADLITPTEGYTALLEFLRAFAERGCDDDFRETVAKLSRTEEGLPADPALSELWMEAWREAERADVGAAVAMTRSPFVESRWRIGEGWSR
jgi:hypothetical protein